MSWQEDNFGPVKVYKDAKSKQRADKTRATNQKKKDAQRRYYEQATTATAQALAKKAGIQYNDSFRQATENYLKNKKMMDNFRQQSANESAKREQAQLKSFSSFANKDLGGYQTKQYNDMRKAIGLNPDKMPTKKKFDDIQATFNRMQQYKSNQKPTSTKGVGSSFDKTVDKGLHGLSEIIHKVSPYAKDVKELANTKIGQTLLALTGTRNKINATKLSLKGMDKVDQYGGASATRNVLADATDNKNQSAKQYLQDVKKGFTGERRAYGDEIVKNLGMKSKYGSKLAGFGIEVLADPTNLLGVGALKVGSKALKSVEGLSKIAKVAEETKAIEHTAPLLLDAPKPGAKFENAKVINPEEKTPKVMNIEPSPKNEPKITNTNKPPKGAKVSKRREPNGILMDLGLIENPKKVVKPTDQIKSKVLANGQLDPTTAPLARVENVKSVPTSNEKALQELKDIKTFQTGTKNIYEVAERLPKEQRDRIINHLDIAKENNVNYQKRHTDDLFNQIVSKGFKKGSKESALIQDYGEKTLARNYLKGKGIDPESVSKEELNRINKSVLQRLRPNDWEDFVKADEYFRTNYKKHIDKVNEVRAQIYPNQPDRLVPERQDYYHHFNEMDGLEGVMNQLSSPANIDPKLVGISHQTKPKTKFQGFMQKRGLGPYKSDAIGGYLKYLQAASHSINVDPVISTLKGTAKEIAEATGETKNANNIIEVLQDHAGDLAGKTNPFDRVLLKAGRKSVNIASTINNRVKTNMILGNLGSALGQLGNIPLAVGKAKQHSITGLGDTLSQLGKFVTKGEKNAPIHQSKFMKERYLGKSYSRFDQKLIDQPKKMAVWMLETADQVGSSFTWNSMYRKGIAKNVPDPIKYADTETRKIIGGRGIGEMPLFQKSKTAQILVPFTYEVGNQWKVLRSMVGEKDAAGIITFLVASYGLNKAMEQIRGGSVSLDPLDALIDGYRDKDGNVPKKILAAIGSLSGEVVGNIPGGNLAVGMLGDKKIKGTDSTINDIFQKRNPNRFGTGLTASKVIENPSFGLLPFGANQVKKTYEGIKAVRDKGVYKDNGEMMYPIQPDFIKALQLGTMGKYSTSEGRDYFKNDRRPLSGKQTQRVDNKKGEERLKEYLQILKERKDRAEKRKQ
jgi:hypothetical protein